MARTKLSKLKARLLIRGRHRIERHQELGRAEMLRFIADNGRCVFQVSPDDLFDADGNRFEDDL